MLTLKQFFQRTDRARRARAARVRIIGMKTGRLKSGLGYVASKSYSTHKLSPDGKWVKNTNPNTYITVITFIDARLHVHVACSCMDYAMRWEVANWYRDAGTVEYSNGEPPLITNPTFRSSLCKHEYALVLKILNKLPQEYRPTV